jgi:tetratricopeptide (TPR) repeat protein
MKTLFLPAIILAVAFVSTPSTAGSTSSPQAEESLANKDLEGLYARSIEQVLRLPPEEIDLGTAALIVSESWSNVLPGRRYQQQLDDMAIEIRSRLQEKGIPLGAAAIQVINDYLYKDLKFKAIDKADDPEDLFLHSVLDRKQGYCLSLSVLYLSVGERLGLPLYGVVVPGHFFVRFDDSGVSGQRFNIEATSKGGYITDEDYIRKFNVPRDNQNIYMLNLNKRQTLGCFFNNLGNVYHDIGNINQAMAALEWAVYINPSLAESRLNLGSIYLQKDRLDDAISQLQHAIQINPNEAKAHANLGSAYRKRKWFGDSVSEFTAAIRLEPNLIDAYKMLAETYMEQNRLPEAGTILAQAITISPGDATLYVILGEVYARSNKCDEAISRYDKAIALKSDFAEAYAGLGFCYGKLKQSEKEISAYVKALAIKPDMSVALVNLGNAYFNKSQYDSAIEQFKKAIVLTPNDISLAYTIGAAYSNKNDYRRAAEYYLRTIELDPKMAEAHYRLGYVYYKMQMYDKALEQVINADQLGFEIDPNLLKAIEKRN